MSPLKITELEGLSEQLNSSINNQVDTIIVGLSSLKKGEEDLEEVGKKLDLTIELSLKSDNLIQNFPFIKQVSKTRQNMLLSRRFYSEFKDLDDKIGRCQELLLTDEEEIQKALNDPSYVPNPQNILLTFALLKGLREFREQTILLMQSAPSTAIYTVKRYFKKLENIEECFDRIFYQIPPLLIERALPQSLKHDPNTFETSKHLLNRDESQRITKTLTSFNLILQKKDVVERSRLLEILNDLIEKRFTTLSTSTDPFLSLDLINCFWLQDLLTIRESLSPLFPINIMDIFLMSYQRHLGTLCQTINSLFSKGALPPPQVLDFVDWIDSYNERIQVQLGINAGDLEPSLVDESQLLRLRSLYISSISKSVKEWVGNLLSSESKAFKERLVEPERDDEDLYFTNSFIDLYQIIKQSIEPSLQSSGPSVSPLVVGVLGECSAIIDSFQNEIQIIIQEEKRTWDASDGGTKCQSSAESERQRWFEYYCVMIGNSSLKWTSYLDLLETDLVDRLGEEYLPALERIIGSLGDSMMKIVKKSSTVLLDIIFKVIDVAIKDFYTEKWYKGTDLVETLTMTLDDFFTDWKVVTDSFLMMKIISDVIDSLSIKLIRKTFNKTSKFLMAKGERTPLVMMEADCRSLLDFFIPLRGDAATAQLDPLKRWATVLGSGPRMIALEASSAIKTYPDFPISLLGEALLNRDDLDRPAIQGILDEIKRKVKEDLPSDNTSTTITKKKSLFSRLAVVVD